MNAREPAPRSSVSLDEVLGELHKESRSSILERERTTFDRMADPFSRSLVLFGAGFLGRFTLAGLRTAGIEPLAFADNNAALWGKRVEGLEVLSPSEAVARYGDRACFVVTVYHGAAVREQLRCLSCSRVAPVAPLFWKHAEVFVPSCGLELPHRILDRAEEIREAYSVLGDEASRREFCEQLRWRVLLDDDALSPYVDPCDIYFPPDLIASSDRDVFVDCGAFDGETIRSFLLRRENLFEHIYAVEPDPANCATLRRFTQGLPVDVRSRITVLPYAVGNQNERVGFSAAGAMQSKMSPESGTTSVDCRRLDDLLADARPTYIKLDVEGVEPDTLLGAAGILREQSPVLAVCVYHQCEHLWRIPRLIKSLAPRHEIFLRRYAEDCWELVCYGVPPERMRCEWR